jgi:hypothetical protein
MAIRISGDVGLLGSGTNINLLGNTQLLPSQMPSGSIIQVVQAIKTDTFSVTGSNLTDVPGLSAIITLNNPNNKVMILIDAKVGMSVYQARGRLVRVNNTNNKTNNLGLGDKVGTRPVGTMYSNYYALDTAATGYNEKYWCQSMLTRFVDTPGTDGASVGPFTYKLQLCSYTTNIAYINRTDIWQDGGGGIGFEYDGTMSSTITLLEIAT